jgi:uncharacterized protein YkwD
MPSSIVPDSAHRAAARVHPRLTVSTLSAATALLAALSACGGGAGGGEPVPPPATAPAPAPVPTGPIAAQMAVPTPAGYDAERLAAFNRLNEIRLSARLGMLAQSAQMDRAAQAHAEWMVVNDSFAHEEQLGTPGFTGTDWARRDEVFGYAPSTGSEVIAADTGGAQGIDVLVNSLYHRCALLAIEPDDVGIGWTMRAAAGFSTPLVIDLTRPATDAVRGLGQQAQPSANGVSVWPLDGATVVPIRLGNESPNPVPAQDVLTLGTPVSITIAESRSIVATSFVVTRHASGDVVPTQVLTNQNDPNFLIPHSFIAAVPLTALAPSSRYDVTFLGSTADFGSTSAVPFARTWSFTTGTQ